MKKLLLVIIFILTTSFTFTQEKQEYFMNVEFTVVKEFDTDKDLKYLFFENHSEHIFFDYYELEKERFDDDEEKLFLLPEYELIKLLDDMKYNEDEKTLFLEGVRLFNKNKVLYIPNFLYFSDFPPKIQLALIKACNYNYDILISFSVWNELTYKIFYDKDERKMFTAIER